MASLRGIQQPDLSKKLYKLIKTENHAIGAYESAGRERVAIAQQLSEWGEATNDDGISEVSDKLGVLMAEIAEQEDSYAQSLEEYRGVLKQIRNTESSVQPSRDHKAKVSDEIAKLKYKEPQSTKIVQLEQELVRAEAQSLVAEAQLTNIVRSSCPVTVLSSDWFRLVKSSRKRTTSTSQQQSSVRRSRSSWPGRLAAFSTSLTIHQSSQATPT